MKKLFVIVLSAALLFGCSSSKKEEKKLIVSATAVPHAEILEEAKPILKEKYGIDLVISETDNYYLPNKALDAKDVDANYFQHLPFFESEVENYGYKIVNAAGIHIEPIGIYSKTYTSAKDIKDGSTVIISNSVTDHGRILSVFETAGLIELDPKVEKLSATIQDIVKNPKNLVFKAEIAPELLSQAYKNSEADLVAINSNYALDAGLNPLKDAIILESSEDNQFVNIVAVREGTEKDERIVALIEVLKSEEITNFILEKYQGSVVPVNK